MTKSIHNTKIPDTTSWMESLSQEQLRIVVLGNVDAGKSSLIGLLKSSELDDGRGSSRSSLSNMQHEILSGRTSTSTSHLIGMKEDGRIVPNLDNQDECLVKKADSVISLFDLPGHEKYFKTAVHGITKSMPDYALILVNSRQGPNHMTQKHVNICSALGLPMILVLSKVDGCPVDVKKASIAAIPPLLNGSGTKKYMIQKTTDVDVAASHMDVLTPIVPFSAVTGEGLDALTKLLITLPKRRRHHQKMNRPFEMMVDEVMTVSGVGTVVSGIVNAGSWTQGETVYVGPTKSSKYIRTSVRSAHVARTTVPGVWAGHSACFALGLRKDEKSELRKGMVIVKERKSLIHEFVADITMLKGMSTTITCGKSQMFVNILTVRQSATLLGIDVTSAPGLRTTDSMLGSGMKARLTLSFKRPEYVRKGMRVVIRDGASIGVGIVHATN